MPITTVLLDADGVIQGSVHMLDAMRDALGGRATLRDLWDVEHPTITGKVDLRESLEVFVAERRIPTSVDGLLDIWLSVRPIPGAMDLVDAVRARGVRVYLATNQQPIRGAHMQANLGYERHFDGGYYSFELGVAKPDVAFFAHIIADLDADASATLFVDDMAENVEGARSAGLVAHWHDRDNGLPGLAAILRGHGVLD